MVEIKKVDLIEVRCPYCDDFYDYIIPEDFFWDEMEKRTVWCKSNNCRKPFLIEKSP